jgi:hypothetical protein
MDSDENCDRAFEIIGVYFANCYWNRHYKTAVDAVNDGKYLDMHEAYKAVIERYNREFGRQEQPEERINQRYTDVIESLKEYYETQINKMRMLQGDTITVRLSYRDFVDTITKYFLPKEEYEAMLQYDGRKERNFRAILTQTLAKFTMHIIQDGVIDVIDRQVRADVSTMMRYMRSWSDKFTTLLTKERNDFCNLILASRSGIDISKENMGSVPKLVVDRLQEEIRDLITEKLQLENTVNKYADYIDALKALLMKSEKKCAQTEKALRKAVSHTVPVTSIPAPSAAPVPNTVKTTNPAPGVTLTMNTKPEKPAESSSKADEVIQKIKDAEFSGEEYIKEPEDDEFMEEIDSSDESGDLEDSDESGDPASSDDDSDLSSGEELVADE